MPIEHLAQSPINASDSRQQTVQLLQACRALAVCTIQTALAEAAVLRTACTKESKHSAALAEQCLHASKQQLMGKQQAALHK